MSSTDENYEITQQWFDRKSQLMEAMLGPEHTHVWHAMFPYAVGGALDLYFYPNGIAGTAIATKELCELPTEGSTNDQYDLYELVMFTRRRLVPDDAHSVSTPFGNARATISSILNPIARYSAEATLNPNETCEFPREMERVGGKCLIFDGYDCREDEQVGTFGLLLIIEIFRSEMNFARENGGAELLERLRTAGYYPHTDMDRRPVA